MDEDDAAAARSRSPIPPPNGAGTVTIAAAAPQHQQQQTLTLALPIQRPNPSSSSREDCWSEGATSALIDAWGERFLDLSRGNLKQKHWQDVADAVSSREDYTKTPRTDVQCKNRIDTLKKKYKIEKSKISNSPAYRSPWPFFDRLDLLLGPTHKPIQPKPLRKQPPITTTTTPPPPIEEEEEDDDDSSESIPPVSDRLEGVRAVAKAVARLGEVYERVERGRMEMEAEAERRRIGFFKEIENQRVQFYMKAQMEIIKFKKKRPRRNEDDDDDDGDDDDDVDHDRAAAN
ncbi:trihelix transcription factor ASIL2-like [Dioscorea cayenensis subsp. rotundata]|uniref:Trihelix transcription factor ASIL2-like n=1 Tax=Dioscorea cayennensis subsp. rotundata TaxID=55577 RepID=A0AB40ATK7_DIOCR|nr:trihelix transcription factor ASIL2-like [Dioscorea cayenensis subsp. rotundata]